jgi:hypothetical protein
MLVGSLPKKMRQKSLYKKQQRKNPSPYIAPKILFGLAGKDDF